MNDEHLTTNQGVPVTDNQSSQTVGERGPVLLQDVHLIEKLAHFDRERIAERVCLLYTSPSPRDGLLSRMPSSA